MQVNEQETDLSDRIHITNLYFAAHTNHCVVFVHFFKALLKYNKIIQIPWNNFHRFNNLGEN